MKKEVNKKEWIKWWTDEGFRPKYDKRKKQIEIFAPSKRLGIFKKKIGVIELSNENECNIIGYGQEYRHFSKTFINFWKYVKMNQSAKLYHEYEWILHTFLHYSKDLIAS